MAPHRATDRLGAAGERRAWPDVPPNKALQRMVASLGRSAAERYVVGRQVHE